VRSRRKEGREEGGERSEEAGDLVRFQLGLFLAVFSHTVRIVPCQLLCAQKGGAQRHRQ
jgi:hypothetical protein